MPDPPSYATPEDEARTRTARGFALILEDGEYEKALEEFETAIRLAPDYGEAYVGRCWVRKEEERFEEALADAEMGVRLDPKDAGAWSARGNTFLLLEQYERALTDHTEALRLNENNCRVGYTNRGRAYAALERYEEALADYNAALQLQPDDVSTLYCRGRVFVAQGDHAAALADFERIIDLDPQHAPAHKQRAHRYYSLNDYERALPAFAAAIELDSEDGDLFFYRAKCFQLLERYEEALADFDEAIRRQPDDGANHLVRGIVCSAMDNDAEAIRDFDEAIRLGCEGDIAYRKRGVSHAALQHWEAAISDYDEAIRRAPSNALTYIYRATAYYNSDQYERAVADYTTALDLNPDDATVYKNRGNAFCQLEQFDAGIADYDEAIRRAPNDGENYIERGHAFYNTDEYAKAVADYTAALAFLRDATDRAALYRYRGNAFRQLKQFDAAFADYEQMLCLAPHEGENYLQRGYAYFNLDQYEEAADDFERALALGHRDASTYRHLGTALIKIDAPEEALASFEEAIRLEPTGALAHFCAHLLRSWGETEEALAAINEELQLHPEQKAAYVLRAGLREQLGEYENALADFDEAIRLKPDEPSYFYSRARLWDLLESDDLADADWERAEQLESRTTEEPMTDDKLMIYNRVQEHFAARPLAEIDLAERQFPARIGADLQLVLDELTEEGPVSFFAAQHCGSPVRNFTELYTKDRRNPVLAGSPQYQEIDIGEAKPVRCLYGGLWLRQSGETRYAVILDTGNYGVIRFQVAAPSGPEGTRVAQGFFQKLEEGVQKSRCYRGKILSLEHREMYSGQSYGILVHQLRQVPREQVILPPRTLALLDRNVLQFVQQRPQLRDLGMATKKGLLFYGPPGTGKTHTIHYLMRAVPEQTTFLIAAEQVGLLADYLTLARLFQPSMVVIEDVDLIARERGDMRSAGEEVLLNKLLNEMDGLRPDADILFVLTTNQPEALEHALASRPGRIDQAVEFPLPDEDGRGKLVRLYAERGEISDEVAQAIVKKTDQVTASFIKELMRRSAQFALARNGSRQITVRDVDDALEELLFAGGSLNRKLLGAGTNAGRIGFSEGSTSDAVAR